MEFVQHEAIDGIGVITLDRAEVRNAQHEALLQELDAAWRWAATEDSIRVIVLKANGPHFSAGHDMRNRPASVLANIPTMGLEAVYRWEVENYLGMTRRWRDVPKPSIAAVQGACIGGGLMLVWPCDLIVAAADAKFSDPVVRMGIGGVEYHGHTWEFGARKAKELLFTGDYLSADEALRLGMVNRVVPTDQLLPEVMALARRISEMHPFALAQAKRAVNVTLDIMGQYAALQAVFDIHQTGHGNALTVSGRTVLADLEEMKRSGGSGQERETT